MILEDNEIINISLFNVKPEKTLEESFDDWLSNHPFKTLILFLVCLLLLISSF